MKRRNFFHFLYIITVLFAAACTPSALTPSADQNGPPRGGDLSPTPTVFVPTETANVAPEMTPTTAVTEVSATPTQGTASGQQFLAYISNGQLLVTDVTN